MAEEMGMVEEPKSSEYRNGTWIWKKSMSFQNFKYSMDRIPYEWCLREPKRLKSIEPQMKIQIRNHKLLTQMPGELEHAIKCRCKQSCTLDDIENNLKDLRKRKNIGKYSAYKISSFKDRQPLRVYIKEKAKERVSEVTKKKNPCKNCVSTDHYANIYFKERNKIYSIKQVPEDSESDSMGDAIREHPDDNQDPKEKFLVEYQEEKQLEIEDIQLEAGMPQDTAKKPCVKTHKMHRPSESLQLAEWHI
ncbi:hypothetical protein O181_079353 [Austropuccinia psidii MF-1]|uniref:Uncharacterized protein n=1 Tax=Austropuccinia psidii MF-1 TaxID=1389203 RepID=A0A9Q3FKS6_9BASI|nr:hypothetical protein [Austropuccinia psidii MF-1]